MIFIFMIAQPFNLKGSKKDSLSERKSSDEVSEEIEQEDHDSSFSDIDLDKFNKTIYLDDEGEADLASEDDSNNSVNIKEDEQGLHEYRL